MMDENSIKNLKETAKKMDEAAKKMGEVRSDLYSIGRSYEKMQKYHELNAKENLRLKKKLKIARLQIAIQRQKIRELQRELRDKDCVL